jgi:EAL domain-containing protein (putative c-di-GMP-specific phosphodiesterase class I)/ActR/RegA family two-component response regulator
MSTSFTPMFDASRLHRVRGAIRAAIGRPAGCAAGSDRVLVVDDDPQVRSLLDKVIRRMGFESRVLESVDAVDRPAADGAALLLLDLHAGGNGLTLIEQLATAGMSLPVVLMSGYGSRVLDLAREACVEQNCPVAGLLSKPFEMAALETILARFRGRGGAARMGNLREAIETGEVVPFYQPIVDMHTGRAVGAEALVRWVHPEYGVMLPADILPEAGARGLMAALTWRMLGQSLRDWSALAGGAGPFDVSVNVSVEVVMQGDFVARVSGLLAEHGVPPRRLTLEITGPLSALEVPQICATLCSLRSAGVNLALDDFGAGQSSLMALRDLPFNRIKLDRAFVTHAETRPEERMVMASVTRLARDFGLESVAEGIESQGCFELARELGMDYGQGDLMGAPMPREVFQAFPVPPR